MAKETFGHLGFLVHFFGMNILNPGSHVYFANSDPDMSAALISAAQVHVWILQNVASSLEFYTEKSTDKERNPGDRL
jgi:TBCC domain-containing protein 1